MCFYSRSLIGGKPSRYCNHKLQIISIRIILCTVFPVSINNSFTITRSFINLRVFQTSIFLGTSYYTWMTAVDVLWLLVESIGFFVDLVGWAGVAFRTEFSNWPTMCRGKSRLHLWEYTRPENIYVLDTTLDCFASPWNSVKLRHLTKMLFFKPQ